MPNDEMKKVIDSLAVLFVLAGVSLAQQPARTPPAAPPVAVPSPVEAKLALCEVDQILSPMDGIELPASEASLCQPSFSMENLPKYIAAGGEILDFAALGNDLVMFYEFRALALNNPDQCAALTPLLAVAEKATKKTLTANSNWERNCRSHVNEIRFVRALVTHDPQAVPLCQAWNAGDQGGQHRKDSEASDLCPKFVNASDLNALARQACNGSPENTKKCVDFFRSISGDAAACHGGYADSHAVLCRGYVAFAKAGPAKNAALCGDNDFCQAMSGVPAKGSLHASRRVAGDFGPLLFAQAHEALKALTDAADPLNESLAREIDSREERIARLRLQHDANSRKPTKALKGRSDAQEK